MTVLSQVVAAKVRGNEVSLATIVEKLAVAGRLQAFVIEGVEELLAAEAAEKACIRATTEQMQEAADSFRRDLGLEKASDTHDWLKENGLTVEGFEAQINRAVVRDLLAEKVTADKVEPYFAEHRVEYDGAVLSQIVVADQAAAQELLTQIKEEGADFATLARQHSTDAATKQVGGLVGQVSRPSLSDSVASAVFAAKAGDVVGPIKTDMGYHIIKIEELALGQLTDEVRQGIADELFKDWLAEQFRAAKVEIVLG